MNCANRKFLMVLEAELDELQEELVQTIDQLGVECECGKITNYVCRENRCVLKNELISVRNFHEILHRTLPDQFCTLRELIHELKQRFYQHLKDHCLYEAVMTTVDRRFARVEAYVSLKEAEAN